MRPLLLALILAVPAAATAKKVAVPKMKASGADIQNMASPLTEILTTELESLVDVDVIGSSDISAMLGFEKEKELLGCDDVSCMAEIGGALGVDFLLVSEIGKVGSTYVLNLKLIDTASGAVLKRGYRSVAKADGLIGAVKPALAVVAPLLSPAKASAPAPAPSPEPEPEPDEPMETTAVTPPTEVSASEGPSRWPQWTLIIGGGALLATSGTFAILAMLKHNAATESDRTIVAGTELIAYPAGQDERRAGIQSQVAVGCAIAGALAGGAGLIWLLMSDDTATITPQVSSEGVGLSLTGRF